MPLSKKKKRKKEKLDFVNNVIQNYPFVQTNKNSKSTYHIVSFQIQMVLTYGC